MSLAAVQSTFETLGRTDPLWAVLTERRFKHNRWDPQAFFATGQREIRDLIADLDRLGLAVARGRALDFGCAVGRLTQPLGDHFSEVLGVDISRSFLDHAERHNRHGPRCRYLHNTRGDLAAVESGSFDLVYSNITLQHIPQEHAARYVEEFFRVLAPGGVAVFQIPSGTTSFDGTLSWVLRRFRAACTTPIKRWWRRRRGQPVIGMYPIARADVEVIVRRGGGRMVDVAENTDAGKGWRSYRYTAVREAHAA